MNKAALEQSVNRSAVLALKRPISAGPVAKRARVSGRQPKCVVLDIEGTVAPIAFVTETLFPYAKKNLRSFLSSTLQDPDTQKAIAGLRAQAEAVCHTRCSPQNTSFVNAGDSARSDAAISLALFTLACTYLYLDCRQLLPVLQTL